MEKYSINDVFGLSRSLPLNYVERKSVDDKFKNSLDRKKHVIIFGSSKQGKTCLRKHCLKDSDYVVIQCSRKMTVTDINSSILKKAGYEITESTKKSVSGRSKIVATLRTLLTPIQGEVSSEVELSNSKEVQTAPLELDVDDVNDVISALNQSKFCKYIVIEDFHYLTTEVQRDFSIELKAFHENSTLCFIIVGVWLDENKMLTYNGDLTGRLIPINADKWEAEELKGVINSGASLLNVSFPDDYANEIIEASSGNVYIVQEVCNRICTDQGINNTLPEKSGINTSNSPMEIVNKLVSEQSARYNSFLTNYARGFQDTTLEMHKWLLYPLIISSESNLLNGLTYREISKMLKQVHPSKNSLNQGNITQALKAVASLQVEKNIVPIIIDYDETNRVLHVVDRGFIIWKKFQIEDDLLEIIGIDCASTDHVEQMALEM